MFICPSRVLINWQPESLKKGVVPYLTEPTALITVEGLTVQFPVRGRQPISAVEDVSFEIAAGEIFGLVGESGSGKTVLVNSLLRLTPEPGSIANGKIVWAGNDLIQ